ncbi:MAG: hypothetical protein ABJG88_06555 [Litorimonas sp.]
MFGRKKKQKKTTGTTFEEENLVPFIIRAVSNAQKLLPHNTFVGSLDDFEDTVYRDVEGGRQYVVNKTGLNILTFKNDIHFYVPNVNPDLCAQHCLRAFMMFDHNTAKFLPSDRSGAYLIGVNIDNSVVELQAGCVAGKVPSPKQDGVEVSGSILSIVMKLGTPG